MPLNSSPALRGGPEADAAVDAPAAGARRPRWLALVLATWAVIVAVLGLAIWSTGSLEAPGWSVESHFFWRQDAPVLALMLAATALLALAPTVRLASLRWPIQAAPRRWVLGLALTVFVTGAAGVWLVFAGYTFSLDEFMANFDARIFASGRLMAPIAPAWRPYAPALQPMFTLPLPDSVWVSSYLPVNAALRAAARLLHADGLVNPLLSGLSVLAVWGVGRRLWPDRPDLALIAAALLATSSQLIVMAMTAYAMPAHLALNLAWLWLFLRGGKWGHAGATAVGFFATGIHQLAFHPLFVAPFILQLLWRRRWRLAGLYIGAYAAICLFWLEYWPIATALSGVSTEDTGSTGFDYFSDRVGDILDRVSFYNIGILAESLVRFATWQNLVVAPLALIGAVMSISARGPIRALSMGVAVTLVVVAIVMPTQVHGWGYRYMHGLLGSVCLIAAWAWGRLTDSLGAIGQTAARNALVLACGVSLGVVAPLRTWQAWDYVRPFARANAAIQHADADVVIIDHDSAVLFDMGTVTRNDPFLRRRPKVMALMMMSPDMLRQLCASGRSIAVFNARDALAFGMDTMRYTPDPGPARLRALMAQLHCGRPIEAR